MEKQLNIYWIGASAYFPVCDAGAVVIAKNPKEALSLVTDLNRPDKPVLIGKSNRKKSEVIVTNNGDY